MSAFLYAIMPFRYPIGTLFSRQHAQHADIIHTMHTMHKGVTKSGGLEYAINLDSYKDMCPIGSLLWEQEVGGSNPLAPTIIISDSYTIFFALDVSSNISVPFRV